MKIFLVIAIALAVAQARPQEDTVDKTESPVVPEAPVDPEAPVVPVEAEAETRFSYADEKYEHIKYETLETKEVSYR